MDTSYEVGVVKSIVCAECGVEVEVKSYSGSPKYCADCKSAVRYRQSRESATRSQAKAKEAPRICERCGVEFPWARKRLRCPSCVDFLNKKSMKDSYERRKNTPEFKAISRECRKRLNEATLSDPNRREKRIADTKAWREQNREHRQIYDANYRKANRLAVAEKNRKRRARLLDAWDEDVDILDLFHESNGLCGICNESIDVEIRYPNPMALTMDHVVPLSRGGRHNRENTQAAHSVCNSRKNDRLVF